MRRSRCGSCRPGSDGEPSRVVQGRLAWQLILALLLAVPAAVRSEPAAQPSLVRPMPRPGSREEFSERAGAKTPAGAFVKSASGLWVPDHRLTLVTQQDLSSRKRWAGMRRAVLRKLKASGARLSPAPYQRLLTKIRRRAEPALAREGQSLGRWKMLVLEGGRADQVNAAAWSGGVITIYRPLVDLCFQIATAAQGRGARAALIDRPASFVLTSSSASSTASTITWHPSCFVSGACTNTSASRAPRQRAARTTS